MDFPDTQWTRELRVVNKPFRKYTVQRKYYNVWREGFWNKRERKEECWVTLDRWGNTGYVTTPLEFWNVDTAREFMQWWKQNYGR